MKSPDPDADLVQLLVDRKVISTAQAQIVKADSESTGMSAAEVLVARRWVTEARLKEEAPWLDDGAKETPLNSVPDKISTPKSDEDIYQENLLAYKALMRKMLGDDIYDS